jgi:hypothetical protein
MRSLTGRQALARNRRREGEAMSKRDDQFDRIEKIVSADVESFEEGVARFYDYLAERLKLPCEVTGVEDFNWEEIYIFGPGDEEEYDQLKKTQPSHTDRYDLLGLKLDKPSEWMIVPDDIAARVRRKSDGKKFILALSELKATDRKSPNYGLLDDYSVWFVNSR